MQPPSVPPSQQPPPSRPPEGYRPQMPLGYPAGYWYAPPPPNLTPAPERKPDPVRRWLIVGVVLLVVAFMAYAITGAVRLFNEGIGPPRDATVDYFVALKTHDWQTAHDQLSASLRAANSPADLERTWLRREQANGTLDRFEARNVSIRSYNGVSGATVDGTVQYIGGVTDPKIIQLVREGDDWKLATLP